MRYWLLLLLPFAAMAQSFEVASVKASVPRPVTGGRNGSGSGMGCPQSIKLDAGRLDIVCATLPSLIAYAFRISPARIHGPDWMTGVGSPRFDVQAKLPETAKEDQAPEMLQALLADRFKLVAVRATTNQTMYALIVAKGGPKLPAGDPSAAPAVHETEGKNRTQHWESANIDSDGLTDLIDTALPLPTPVANLTGLTGRYRLVLDVALNDLPGFSAPIEMEDTVVARFNEGLQRLGLQLERRKGPLPTIEVRSVEKTPSGNN
jgi:uncharacterized protein (TIGR03435 family)